MKKLLVTVGSLVCMSVAMAGPGGHGGPQGNQFPQRPQYSQQHQPQHQSQRVGRGYHEDRGSRSMHTRDYVNLGLGIAAILSVVSSVNR